jgi:hypothetical protein
MIFGNVYCEDFSNNALFNKESPRNSDGLFDAIILLREELLRRGIEVNTPDLNGTRAVAFELHLDGRTLATGKLPKYLIAMENPYINKLNSDAKYLQLFRMVFTWNDAARSHCRGSRIMLPNNISAPTSRRFEERPIFACLISENKMPPDSRANDLYAKRLEVIRWYEKNAPDKFELYGRGWRKPSPAFSAREKINRRIGRLRTQLFGHKPFPSWKGEVDRKSKVLANSKFSYCFENVKDLPNYITEKIFDCFRSGCVPIYWGANNVLEYIPKSCFIDRRDFENTEEVHHYLLTIGTQEFEQYQQSIAAFMSSVSAQQFSNEHFASAIASDISNDLLNLSGI